MTSPLYDPPSDSSQQTDESPPDYSSLTRSPSGSFRASPSQKPLTHLQYARCKWTVEEIEEHPGFGGRAGHIRVRPPVRKRRQENAPLESEEYQNDWPCNSNSVCLGACRLPGPVDSIDGLRAFSRNPGRRARPRSVLPPSVRGGFARSRSVSPHSQPAFSRCAGLCPSSPMFHSDHSVVSSNSRRRAGVSWRRRIQGEHRGRAAIAG
jgi:hypothetical protein